jgi:alpha-tubulin suppressor-like RCC1 family protein
MRAPFPKTARIALGLLAGTTLGTSLAAFVVACSDDTSADRPGFDTVDAAPDAPESAPDAGVDAESHADASVPRDPFDPADEAVTCAVDAGPCAVDLVAGSNYFCARMSDGTVHCWGSDDFGGAGEPPRPPKGDPNPPPSSPVHIVDGVTDVTQLSAAGSTTCARSADGSIRCWGSNEVGQLGLDDVSPIWDEDRHPIPSLVALRAPADRVDVGPQTVCATLAGGGISCWGTNEHAELARRDDRLSYVLGPGAANLDPFTVIRTTAGTMTALGLTATGEVVSWGVVSGDKGLISGRVSSVSPDPAPNAIAHLKNVTSLVATSTKAKDEGGPFTLGPVPPPKVPPHAHACALANGEVYCWGRSDNGALCTGLPDLEATPAHAPVKGKAWPQQLAAGDEITCARMTDGSIQCCGAKGRGRLGTGKDEVFSAFFQPVVSFKGHAVRVATSDRAVCALVQGGSVECWGNNSFGELGTSVPDEDSHSTPMKIEF